jgi:hypothetical protein
LGFFYSPPEVAPLSPIVIPYRKHRRLPARSRYSAAALYSCDTSKRRRTPLSSTAMARDRRRKPRQREGGTPPPLEFDKSPREDEFAALVAESPWTWDPVREAFFMKDQFGREIKAPKEWS